MRIRREGDSRVVGFTPVSLDPPLLDDPDVGAQTGDLLTPPQLTTPVFVVLVEAAAAVPRGTVRQR